MRLNSSLASLPHVFQAPPLTTDLILAIKAISPDLQVASEGDRLRWQSDQNVACWSEYRALRRMLDKLQPMHMLEIGPGLGRSLAFFVKTFSWQVTIDAYDATGPAIAYPRLAPRSNTSFCGNLEVLSRVLRFNGVERSVKVIDASRTSLGDLTGSYEFIYSFYSVGFHWNIADFLEDIIHLLSSRGLGCFTVPPRFSDSMLPNWLRCRVVDYEPVWIDSPRPRLLVIGDVDASIT